jgi:hypothetical protein
LPHSCDQDLHAIRRTESPSRASLWQALGTGGPPVHVCKLRRSDLRL